MTTLSEFRKLTADLPGDTRIVLECRGHEGRDVDCCVITDYRCDDPYPYHNVEQVVVIE
jgi:hypothetical protein